MDGCTISTITVPLPPPRVPPMPPFDQIFTIIFGLYVLIIGVLTCALVGDASRWCDIAADCRCGAKTITLPPPNPPQALYQGPRGVLRRAPCPPTRDAAAQLLDRPNPPSPGALYQGPEGRGGIYIPPHGPSSGPSGEEYFVYKHVQTILTNFDTKPSCIRFSPCSNAPYLSNWLRLRDNRTKDLGQRSS